ncbi:uncharacterized protein LOC129303000 [Prosopis cineraria]|uniref:uncharacterized protein LOC129303000 n=1 Tax=Prosopis cineraria TaxID=364024 RepID=UPI0024106764|nr:uncharacterized protein LOC129303000 [Prosopis cineraria]
MIQEIAEEYPFERNARLVGNESCTAGAISRLGWLVSGGILATGAFYVRLVLVCHADICWLQKHPWSLDFGSKLMFAFARLCQVGLLVLAAIWVWADILLEDVAVVKSYPANVALICGNLGALFDAQSSEGAGKKRASSSGLGVNVIQTREISGRESQVRPRNEQKCLPLFLVVSPSSATPSISKICRAPSFLSHNHNHSFLLRVANDADKIVDGIDFGELCNDFECISSPLVESTSRQLARDILELRDDNRAFATLAISVKYRDPLRSFIGRDKYRRPLWARDALNDPSVSLQEMVMLSTSVLCIKWTIRGKPKSLIGGVAGDLILRVTSQFTLNQISGQVIEHEEFWDLSASPAVAQVFFWTSRALFAAVESGKDFLDIAKDMSNRLPTKKGDIEIDPDPSPDPTKFFQRDDSFQRDAYQIALFLAVLYFLVQFLRTTL